MSENISTTDFVNVACKLPHGLILELIDSTPDAVPGTFRTQPMPVGERVALKGSNSLRREQGLLRASQEAHSYAVTAVPREFWEKWLARNANFPFMRRGLVFVVPKKAVDVAAAVRERDNDKTLKTGMEALSPKGDSRLPKSNNPNETIVPDSDHLAKLLKTG